MLEAEFTAARRRAPARIFGERGVPCAPINRYSQVLADSQVQTWVGWPHGAARRRRRRRPCCSRSSIAGETTRIYRRPPALGEHMRMSLANWAYNYRHEQSRTLPHVIAAFTRLIERSVTTAHTMLAKRALLARARASRTTAARKTRASHPQHYQQHRSTLDPLERFPSELRLGAGPEDPRPRSHGVGPHRMCGEPSLPPLRAARRGPAL